MMDIRFSAEQQQLRDAAAKLADDHGPRSVAELDDEQRITRLEKTLAATGWRSLRSDGASGVEVAIVTEELSRGLIDVPFLGVLLADDALRDVADELSATIVVGRSAPDARGIDTGVRVGDGAVLVADLDDERCAVDLTRRVADVGAGGERRIAELKPDHERATHALALVAASAEMLGAARGALTLATDYAKLRSQYGKTIGSYQAISHMLAESLALIEGSISVSRYAAWVVDQGDPGVALDAARVAKVYCARAARTVCETSIQVHGGIGNTWECLAHLYLRRVLAVDALWPVPLKEINIGLP